MPSFSSISLANTKVKFTLFFFAFALALLLYWPGMNGTPIWDDITYLFFDPVMEPDFSYAQIWKSFAWPLSVSAQKMIFSLASNKYWIYHGINLLLHFFNAWLVYRFLLLLRLRRSYAFFGFLFFLIQPASVITVAWMIQFKTLLCFTLTMGSIILFVRARNKRDYIISSFLFLLSILSKSSSLPLPLVLFFLLGQKWKTKKALSVVPFFLISFFGLYQISRSNTAMDAIELASQVTKKVLTERAVQQALAPIEKRQKVEKVAKVEKVVPQAPAPVVETKVSETKVSETKKITLPESPAVTEKMFQAPPDEPLVKVQEDLTPPGTPYDVQTENKQIVEPTLSLEVLSPIIAYSRLIIKTLHYYFWQAYVPVDTSPVKGLNPFSPGLQEYLHLFFLLILILITRGTPLFPILVSAHIFLLPYLGLIPAPYMNVTWVSDQHLYLALPSFVLLFLGLAEKVKSRLVWIPIISIMILFAVKTRETSGYFRNSLSFYEKSLDGNLNNIPIAYNLSLMYVNAGKKEEAQNILEIIINASEKEPYLKENRFFPFIVQLQSQLTQRQENK